MIAEGVYQGSPVTCPECGFEFTLTQSRLDNGACEDGRYYCLRIGCSCGCDRAWKQFKQAYIQQMVIGIDKRIMALGKHEH